MRLLLDTHTLVWWSERSPMLSAIAADTIADTANAICISSVSAYEIALKHRLGKWPEVAAFSEALPDYIDEQGFIVLPLTLDHALRAGGLDVSHKDPWDRMLAAQALVEDLTIVSIDDRLDRFDVRRLW